MKIYTNITIIIRIMQKLFVRDIEGKEWMRGRGWRGRCNMVSTGGVDAICRGWTSVIYSRRTPEAAASPRELRNLPRTSSHGTEIFPPRSWKFPPPLEKWNAAIWQNFHAFWRINVGRKLSLFPPAKRELGWQMRFIFCLGWKLVLSVN